MRAEHRSAATLAAVEARAKAEAARTRASYAQREIDVKVKRAQLKVEETRLDATLEAIQQEKEAEAALAEATIFEAAVDSADIEEPSAVRDMDQGSSYQTAERTEKYVQDQYAYMNTSQPSAYNDNPRPDAEVEVTSPGAVNPMPRDDSPPHHKPVHSQGERQHSSLHAPNPIEATSILRTPVVRFRPKSEREWNMPQSTIGFKSSSSPRDNRGDNGQSRRGGHHASGESGSNVSDLAKFLARRDLLTAGLTKFNDKPENYWAWKSTFSNATEDLDLKPSEELDLLIKWLGPESAEHVRRVRSVRINHPAEALSMVWERLEECYGSAEAMETALFNKLERFPKVSNRDPQRLRELGDLLLELESAKEEGYLSGLSYLDTARGINPILEKLPFSLQDKWMVQGTRYKQQNHVSFPPFSFFSSFIREEARMRNDLSFIPATSSITPPREERFSMKTARTPITVHRTEVDNTQWEDEARGLDNPKKQCPIHKKPHPLQRCRAFRERPLEERKTFLRENGICFRCCSSGAARLSSPRNIMAGRKRDCPLLQSPPQLAQRSVETALQGNHVPDQPEKKASAYAILDDQSNRSLAFFKMFDIADDTSPYTLRTCAGVSETAGRRARGFIVESADEKTSLALPTLIECDQLPDNRAEIPTPAAAMYHAHLKSLATKIPPLDPKAEILLLLGRDIIQAHKVLEQRNGPLHAPFAQRLALGWVIVGEVCLDGAHRPSPVNTFRTYILDNGRASLMSPCPNKINVKESFSHTHQSQSYPASNQEPRLMPRDITDLMGESVFRVTKDDDKTAPSMEDLAFLRIMEREFHQDESNSWVAPLPFRSPRQRLPNNFQQARNRLTSLNRTLRKHPEKVGPSKLTHEVLTTFMAEVAAIVNARPLVPVSTDPDSPFILTPATLLTQKISALPPPQGAFDGKDLYGKQWRQVQSLANTFWHRWRTEYIPTLQRRRKWQKEEHNLHEGDIVILKDNQVKRNEWPMGIIVKTFPSTDGRVRKVEIKTARDEDEDHLGDEDEELMIETPVEDIGPICLGDSSEELSEVDSGPGPSTRRRREDSDGEEEAAVKRPRWSDESDSD
ncbi:uncharacterized protein LOC119478948 [Sebastes umbrosus]|uniref:uncharacterized protein LOC119478948 n=1 Tax=Sebastes umbrosus TaxID=72105 RepID=UPI00189F993E|nr:uncharacterized protein LOC119478948 [Sebastes umbrosus]